MKDQTDKIRIEAYKLVIFDIDGTMYNQRKLRLRMLIEMFFYYLLKPHRIYELKVIKIFREERERRKGFEGENLEEEQYRWVSEITKYSIDIVKRVIERWIFVKPLKYLKKYKYDGLDDFFRYLKNRDIKIGVYSDYSTEDKLVALELPVNIDIDIASTGRQINAFKPSPIGLEYIVKRMGIEKTECLFIGDREITDGECAKNAGIDYLIVDNKGLAFKNLLRRD